MLIITSPASDVPAKEYEGWEGVWPVGFRLQDIRTVAYGPRTGEVYYRWIPPLFPWEITRLATPYSDLFACVKYELSLLPQSRCKVNVYTLRQPQVCGPGGRQHLGAMGWRRG